MINIVLNCFKSLYVLVIFLNFLFVSVTSRVKGNSKFENKYVLMAILELKVFSLHFISIAQKNQLTSRQVWSDVKSVKMDLNCHFRKKFIAELSFS